MSDGIHRQRPRDSFPLLLFVLALLGPGVLAALYFATKAEIVRTLPWFARLCAFDTPALVLIGLCAGLYSAGLLASRHDPGLTCLGLIVGVIAPSANTFFILGLKAHYP